jgi:predicted extracellular nuclease
MRPEFTVASFNLLNLVSADQPFYDKAGPSAREYDQKCNWIAQQFDNLNADVIGVQEVWSEAALQDACARSQTMRRATLISAPGAQPGNTLPKVGIVTRLPVLSGVESISTIPADFSMPLPGPADPRLIALLNDSITNNATTSSPSLQPLNTRRPLRHETFSRPVLKVTLNLASADETPIPVVVHVVHLKSKRPERYEIETAAGLVGEDLDDPRVNAVGSLRSLIMRGAEATAVRQIVLNTILESETAAIVLGDFNDGAEAVTTEIICGRASPHNKEARDYLLYDCAGLDFRYKLKKDVGYTHIYQGEPNTLDHILVSEQFYNLSRRAIYRLSRLDYWNDHLNSQSWTTSDHGIVRAKFLHIEPSSSSSQ